MPPIIYQSLDLKTGVIKVASAERDSDGTTLCAGVKVGDTKAITCITAVDVDPQRNMLPALRLPLVDSKRFGEDHPTLTIDEGAHKSIRDAYERFIKKGRLDKDGAEETVNLINKIAPPKPKGKSL